MEKASASAQIVKNKFYHDLEFEVQLRLPPKSLTRFKSVTKSWGNQISNPLFRDMYHMRSKKSPNLLFYKTPLYHHGASPMDKAEWVPFNTKSLSFGNTFTTGGVKISHMDMMVTPQGMVCFLGSKHSSDVTRVFLYSLCTQVLLDLPMDPSSGFSRGTIIGFGIGYLSSTQKFKVALLFMTSDTNIREEFPNYSCQVIEISDNVHGDGSRSYSKWRMVDEHTNELVDCFHPAVLVENTLHWKAWFNKVIVSFDLENEKFMRINSPDEFNLSVTASSNSLYLVDLHGKLGLLTVASTTQDCCLWKLQDHSSNVWEKTYNFSLGDSFCLEPMRPVFLRDEEIIMQAKGHSVLYNLEKGTVKILNINVPINYSAVGMYHGTLCSE